MTHLAPASMLSRCSVAIAVVATVAAGCEKKGAPPTPRADVVTARLALGATPVWTEAIGLVGHSNCATAFDKPTEPLAKVGRIHAPCGTRMLTFQVDDVDALAVALSASHVELLGGVELSAVKPPFALDHAHPDWTISLVVTPLAKDGKALTAGQDPPATFALAPDCPSVATLRTLDFQTATLTAVGAGTCNVTVAWLGSTTTTSIVVK